MTPAIDFGCHASSMVAALPDAIAVIILFVLLAGLGSSLGGRRRWVAADLISGWGLVVALFTVGGIFIPASLTICAAVAGCAAIITMAGNIYKQPRSSWAAGFLAALALQIWILIFIDHTGITGWDDIAQWTPNALYLWHHSGFPAANLPLPFSNRPAYPYALAYLDYIVSLGREAFVVQAGAMINWLLLASFAWALTAFDNIKRSARSQLMRFGVALLFVTLFNSGFNASFSITGQSDVATSVVAGFMCLLLLHLHAALRAEDRPRKFALMAQLSMTAITLVMLRDMNVIILVMFVGASLLIALREKYLRAAFITWLPGILVPAIFFLLWRHYSQHNIIHDAISPILPFAEWRWSMVAQLLRAAGAEMLKKNGFYGLMFATTGFGIYAFVRGRSDKFANLAVLAGTVFVGYTAFILVAFIGSTFFTEHNIAHAMSFYRYGTHTGLPGIALLWFLFERYLEPRIKDKAVLATALVSLAILPAAYAVKSSVLVPKPNAALCPVRSFGDALVQSLPPQSHLALIDPESNGFEPYILNLEMALDDLHTGNQTRIVASTNMFEPEKLPTLLKQLADKTDIDAVMLRNPTPNLKQFFGINENAPFYLFTRNGMSWKKIPFNGNAP